MPLGWRKTVIIVVFIALCALAYTLFRSLSTSTMAEFDTSYSKELLQKQNLDPAVAASKVDKNKPLPTNRWFSGAVIGPESQPIFPLPYAVKFTNNGFAFNLPTVTTQKDTIFGSFARDIFIANGANSYKLTSEDDVSVTFTFYQDSKATADVKLVQGSPYIYYTAKTEHTPSIGDGWTKQSVFYVKTVGNHRYGLVSAGTVTGDTLSLNAGQTISFFAEPKNSDLQTVAKTAAAIVTGTKASYKNTDSTSQTTFTFATNGGSTLFASMPHQTINSADANGGYYESIYGRLNVYSGTAFSFDTPRTNPSSSIDVSKFTSEQRKQLINQLQIDTNATNLTAPDTYAGGKELYRAANLYELALGLQQKSIASELRSKLNKAMDEWFDPSSYTKRANRYFYYNTTVKGVVGAQPAFGSELFNDHHFHYGYFLYAASIMAKHDASFTSKHAKVINLLAADIGSPSADSYFPKQRVFDAYNGHSWASGNGQFADGNNQESSSEAINAWNGLALWAKETNNTQLASQAEWLLSRETKSAQQYWTELDTSDPVYKRYGHSIAALNWGGKRDYATFFSSSNNAKLGIQLIPFSPALANSFTNKNQISKNLQATNFTEQFSDYLLMYKAGAANDGREAEALLNLQDSAIDSANSKSYALAIIYTR